MVPAKCKVYAYKTQDSSERLYRSQKEVLHSGLTSELSRQSKERLEICGRLWEELELISLLTKTFRDVDAREEECRIWRRLIFRSQVATRGEQFSSPLDEALAGTGDMLCRFTMWREIVQKEPFAVITKDIIEYLVRSNHQELGRIIATPFCENMGETGTANSFPNPGSPGSGSKQSVTHRRVKKLLRVEPSRKKVQGGDHSLEVILNIAAVFKDIILLCLRFVTFIVFTAAIVEIYSDNPFTKMGSSSLVSRWQTLIKRTPQRARVSWLRIAAVIFGISLRITFFQICRILNVLAPIRFYDQRVKKIRTAGRTQLWLCYLTSSCTLGILDKASLSSFLLIAALTAICILSVFIV